MASAPFGSWERQHVDPVFSILGIGQPNPAATQQNALCAAIASARDVPSWDQWTTVQNSPLPGGYTNYQQSRQPVMQFGNCESHVQIPHQTPLQMFETQRQKMEIPSFDEVGTQPASQTTSSAVPGVQLSSGLFKENAGADVEDRITAMFASADKRTSTHPLGLYEVTNRALPAVNPFEQLKAAIAANQPVNPQRELSISAPEFVPDCTMSSHDVSLPEASDLNCIAPPEECAVTTLPPPISSLGPLFDETMLNPQCLPCGQAPAVDGPAELLLRRLSRELLLTWRPKPDSSVPEGGLRTVSLAMLSPSKKKHTGSIPSSLDNHSPMRAQWQPKVTNDQWQ